MHYAYRPNTIEHLYNRAGINIQSTSAIKLRIQLRILLRAWDAGKLSEESMSGWLAVFYPEGN